MALKGDFAKLARLQAQLKSLASNDLRVGLANVLGAAALLTFARALSDLGAPLLLAAALLLLIPGAAEAQTHADSLRLVARDAFTLLQVELGTGRFTPVPEPRLITPSIIEVS